MNPLCPINNGVKDMEHYFLLCHTFGENSLDLLSSTNVILLPHGLIKLSIEELLKIILYDYGQLSRDSNAKILTTTLEYIQASKRSE